MVSSKRTVVLMLVTSLLSSSGNGFPGVGTVYKICNGESYDPHDGPDYIGSPLFFVIQFVLGDVMENTAASQGHSYYAVSQEPDAIAYGHGACDGKLAETDCSTCMSVAHERILDECKDRIGGQLQLQDCRIRFEIYPFIE
ncbi:hypothetical protein CRG98_050036 [Punica granatum]|uniref:Gnk2-homologous domain-containing protein n=1 Tax=Punica granatum TaxID=22663 RepID=A0A2I0GU54_PUNGR|nr:hypothetical protein CRG98_050036 [Punica granatum]